MLRSWHFPDVSPAASLLLLSFLLLSRLFFLPDTPTLCLPGSSCLSCFPSSKDSSRSKAWNLASLLPGSPTVLTVEWGYNQRKRQETQSPLGPSAMNSQESLPSLHLLALSRGHFTSIPPHTPLGFFLGPGLQRVAGHFLHLGNLLCYWRIATRTHFSHRFLEVKQYKFLCLSSPGLGIQSFNHFHRFCLYRLQVSCIPPVRYEAGPWVLCPNTGWPLLCMCIGGIHPILLNHRPLSDEKRGATVEMCVHAELDIYSNGII